MYIHIPTMMRCSESDIRARFSSTNFVIPFSPPEDYVPVIASTEPAHDPITHAVIEVEAVEVDGEWVQQWDLVALAPEAAAANLAQAIALKVEAIKAERDRRIQTGGYFVAPHWYHSDTFSRTQQLGLVLLGANIPAGTIWKTLDNGFIPMTPALAVQIFAAAAASDIAIFKAAETHKAAMLASSEPLAYDFSAGWPAMFEGTV